MIEPGRFILLGKEGSLAEVAWDGNQLDKLWRYNQHYFDDLNARDAHVRIGWHRNLIADWLAHNQPTQGTGWEPYPTSLRIVNWVKWHLNGNLGDDQMRQSLALQARWLSLNVEFHLLGNHLVSNAKALVFAGCFFEGSEADKWRAIGLSILHRELDEQILSDGGNFERSPMYHALGLEDILDLINLANTYPSLIEPALANTWRNISEKMYNWLDAMTHPDGEIAMFNDAAQDVALKTDELQQFAEQLGVFLRDVGSARTANGVTHLHESGYVRLEMSDACAIMDVAPLGPDYLPAHGHADTLSFEASILGERVIVNGGTSCYGLSKLRTWERGTSAHSTVVVNGADSSEIWSGFRVARRAYPFDLVISEQESHFGVTCSHDGYKRLKGSPVHRRSLGLRKNELEIVDSIIGPYRTATAKFLLHHLVTVSQISQNCFMLRLSSGKVVRFEVMEGRARLVVGSHAVRFGELLPTSAINIELVDSKSRVQLSW
ncbi:MAG: heparinase II/III family protein [Sphingorhabdus sp.]